MKYINQLCISLSILLVPAYFAATEKVDISALTIQLPNSSNLRINNSSPSFSTRRNSTASSLLYLESLSSTETSYLGSHSDSSSKSTIDLSHILALTKQDTMVEHHSIDNRSTELYHLQDSDKIIKEITPDPKKNNIIGFNFSDLGSDSQVCLTGNEFSELDYDLIYQRYESGSNSPISEIEENVEESKKEPLKKNMQENRQKPVKETVKEIRVDHEMTAPDKKNIDRDSLTSCDIILEDIHDVSDQDGVNKESSKNYLVYTMAGSLVLGSTLVRVFTRGKSRNISKEKKGNHYI